MKIAYYAHCQSIYYTSQEIRDLDTLSALGFKVLNPNIPEHTLEAEKIKAEGRSAMPYFCGLVEKCDVLAFRAIPGGHIPAGIYQEIRMARSMGIPIIELPTFALRGIMSVDCSRTYLEEVGQR